MSCNSSFPRWPPIHERPSHSSSLDRHCALHRLRNRRAHGAGAVHAEGEAALPVLLLALRDHLAGLLASCPEAVLLLLLLVAQRLLRPLDLWNEARQRISAMSWRGIPRQNLGFSRHPNPPCGEPPARRMPSRHEYRQTSTAPPLHAASFTQQTFAQQFRRTYCLYHPFPHLENV